MFKRITLLFQIVFVLLTNNFAQDIESGKKLIEYEKYSAAVAHFNSMLNSGDKAQAYFYLGDIYFLNDKMDSARTSYLKGANADPDFALNYAGLAKVSVVTKDDAGIESNFNRAKDIGGEDNPQLYIILSEGYSHSSVKNYDKAIELLSNAVRSKKKNIDAFLHMGNAQLSKGKGTEAIQNYEEALKMDPNSPKAMMYKSRVYILINNYNEAITLLNQAIQSDPAYAPAYNELAELYANQKDYAKAAEYYKKYMEAAETTPETQKRYASLLYLNKDYQSAISILESLIQADPNSASSIRILAFSYLKTEDVEKSKGYFKQLFAMDSVDYLPADYENYADLLSKTGDDEQALELLSKIIAADSSRNDILGKMSVLYFKDKNWAGVISTLSKKTNLTAQEYFDLSKAYIFRGDAAISGNLDTLKTALTLDENASTLVREALLYYQKDLREARNDEQMITAALNKLTQSIETAITNGSKPSWSAMKTSWTQKVRSEITTDYAVADSLLDILITKAPQLAVAQFWKARVNTNFDPETISGTAKPYYEKFIELAKGEPEKYKKELIESYSYLGYYYYLQEDFVKSKEFWQEVLIIDPENVQASEVIKQLK
jgi:tetratricopeptide (TPR) repeat protein